MRSRHRLFRNRREVHRAIDRAGVRHGLDEFEELLACTIGYGWPYSRISVSWAVFARK
jgi:hypothetical protein